MFWNILGWRGVGVVVLETMVGVTHQLTNECGVNGSLTTAPISGSAHPGHLLLQGTLSRRSCVVMKWGITWLYCLICWWLIGGLGPQMGGRWGWGWAHSWLPAFATLNNCGNHWQGINEQTDVAPPQLWGINNTQKLYCWQMRKIPFRETII